MFIGWLLYLIFNLRRAKPEIGSEIELAPNRRPYYDDDILETRHLEHVQLWGLAMLVIIAIGFRCTGSANRDASGRHGGVREALRESGWRVVRPPRRAASTAQGATAA